MENKNNENIILFNAQKDSEFLELSEAMEMMEKEIFNANAKELKDFKEKFERTNPPNPIPKYSKEYFNTMKILEGVIKQKE